MSTHSCLSQAQNLITNGNFQNGFTAWTQSGTTTFTNFGTIVDYGLTSPDPSVTTAAQLGPPGSDGFLTQTITGTQGGTCYQLRFFLNNNGGTPNDFTVSYNGVSLKITASADPTISVPILDSGPFDGNSFLEFKTVVTATNGPQTLRFGFRQDHSYFYLTLVTYSLSGESPEVLCE